MEEKKLRELMASLTLQEKIGQLVQLSGEFFQTEAMAVGPAHKLGINLNAASLAGSVLNVVGAQKIKQIQENYLTKSRHKIPLLFMADIIYGYKTIYPIPLAQSCSFNPSLVKRNCEKIAVEANVSGAHVTFAPMVDVSRDARWGRVMESMGEDTYLTNIYAKAMVEGFQGDFSVGSSIASCVKHFAAYSQPEAGRDYNTVDMSTRQLFEVYLPPFKAAVDAGCEMLMTAFNTVNGIPATGNEWLMNQVLRKSWNFEGVVIADYAAVAELVMHGVAEDEKAASRLAMEACVDIDMRSPCYANQLELLVKEGQIDVEKVDQAVWRILQLKNKLGLFEDPYRGSDEEKEKQILLHQEHRKLARESVSESVVLLKNRDGVLPLNEGEKIALIGPYSDSQDLIGLWAVHGRKEDVVSLKKALSDAVAAENFKQTKGCDILNSFEGLGDFGFSLKETITYQTDEERVSALEQAIDMAKWADTVILAMGEHKLQSGEGGSRTALTLPGIQQEFLRKLLPWCKRSVLLLFSGRPLIFNEIEPQVDAILACWFPGTEGGHGIVDILLGKNNPSGRLTMSFPKKVGQVPIYYNHFNTGRPISQGTRSSRFMSRYIDCDNEPAYPFGYGLSYHESELSNLRLNHHVLRSGSELVVTCDVTNKSHVAGREVIGLYIRDLVGSVVRPVKELKDFKKILLKPYETKEVQFTINEDMLKFYTKELEYKAEAGEFQLFIGLNSAEAQHLKFHFVSNSMDVDIKG